MRKIKFESNAWHLMFFLPFHLFYVFQALWIISRFSGGFRHFSTCLQILRIKHVNIIVLNEYWFDPKAFVYWQQRAYSHKPSAKVWSHFDILPPSLRCLSHYYRTIKEEKRINNIHEKQFTFVFASIFALFRLVSVAVFVNLSVPYFSLTCSELCSILAI